MNYREWIVNFNNGGSILSTCQLVYLSTILIAKKCKKAKGRENWMDAGGIHGDFLRELSRIGRELVVYFYCRKNMFCTLDELLYFCNSLTRGLSNGIHTHAVFEQGLDHRA